MTAAKHISTARGKGGRPSLEKAGQIKSDILVIASDFFLREGYGDVSIEKIAKAAGISKRTFYHRFADKAELFAAVIHHLTQGMRPKDESHLFEGENIQAILLKLAEAILHAALMPSALSLHRLLLSEAGRFPDLSEVIAKSSIRQEAIDMIAKLLEKEKKAGHITLRDPLFAAEQFLQLVMAGPQRRAMGLGVQLTSHELNAWASNCVELFLHGCRYGS